MGKSQRKPPAAPAAAAPQPHDLIQVTWLDAAFDLDKDPGLEIMQTVGYLIRHTDELLLLAGESNAKLDYFRSYTCIPAGMIRGIIRLSV